MGFENINTVNPAKRPENMLPKSFYEYLKVIGATAVHLSIEDKIFRQVDTIAMNILSVHQVKKGYLGVDEQECFRRFYQHIKQSFPNGGLWTRGLNDIEISKLEYAYRGKP